MILDRLTTEEKKEIFIKLFDKVETNKSLIVATIRYNEIAKIGNTYVMNLYNGYEFKSCAIDSKSVVISSESLETNEDLTVYYKKLLKRIIAKKKLEELADLESFSQSV